MASGRRRRLTVDDADHPGCAWSHDGDWVLLNHARGGRCNVLRAAVGGAAADTLYQQVGWAWPLSASPDGKLVLFADDRGLGGADLMAVPLSGAGRPIPVAVGPGFEEGGQFAPNGRWVAYTSNETGRQEVYVVSFPESGGKWQVSLDGGREPRWNRNGRELLYVDRDNRIISVEVSPGSIDFETGATTPLFQLHATGGFWRYDVTPDGARFLVTVPPDDEAPPPITLMTNWTAKLGG
jgi:serine/threonine-protein kinase